MKNIRLFALFALLLMAGGVTMQAQTEDDFWMGIDPPTTSVHSLIEDAEGNIILGATGAYSSSDDGATWNLIGLEECGILCLYEHTDGALLAGSNFGEHALYKREAGSTEWKALPVPTIMNGVSMGVTSDNSLLLGTWEGIYKSTDWDSTWTNVYVDHSMVCEVTALLRLNNGTMLATIYDHIGMGMGGVFKSTDNGETWDYLALSDKYPVSLANNSKDEIYVGCIVNYDPNNHERGFFKSSDYGETWEEFLPDQCIQSITVDDNDVIYVNLYCDAWGDPFGIYRWENGEDWLWGLHAGMPDKRIEKQFLSNDGYLYAFGQYDNQIYRSRKSVYDEFEIDVVTCPEIGGTAIGSGTYYFGEFANLSATANENYQFVGWTNQDGDTISTEQEFAHMIARGGQITANFVSIEGVDETEKTSLMLWPNPVSQTIHIDGLEFAEVKVYNSLGQLVKEIKDNVLDLSDQEAGIYIIKVITPSETITKQIIKK